MLISVCSGNAAADFLEKTLAKSKCFASMVTRALSVIKAAIWTLRSRYTFIASAKKVVTFTTKAFYFGSNSTFANFFKLMIWTLLMVGKAFTMV